VASKLIGLRFENANGADIDFFPGFCLIQESKEHDYALIDLCDIDLRFAVQRFIEDDELPKDALIIGHAWEKSNKDGSPDRRFRNNRQLPIMGYGQLEFRTNQGLNEAYMISDQERAKQFAIAFIALQNSLRSSSSKAAEIDTLGSPQTLVEPASEYQSKRRCCPIDFLGSCGFSDVRFFGGRALPLEGPEDERAREGRCD